MVVSMSSIRSTSTTPVHAAPKLTANKSVCSRIDCGDPIQRVAVRAVFLTSTSMGCLQRIGLWSPLPQRGALPLSYRHHTLHCFYTTQKHKNPLLKKKKRSEERRV